MNTHTHLEKWIQKRGGRLLWEQPVRNVGTAHAYQIGESVAIIMTYATKLRPDDMGWDVFVPASLDTAIDATLSAADKALMVK